MDRTGMPDLPCICEPTHSPCTASAASCRYNAPVDNSIKVTPKKLRKAWAELVVSREASGDGPSVQQAAAMMGNSEPTLRRSYAVNTRAGLAQAGVAAMGRLAATVVTERSGGQQTAVETGAQQNEQQRSKASCCIM
jgi:hypothetical protein